MGLQTRILSLNVVCSEGFIHLLAGCLDQKLGSVEGDLVQCSSTRRMDYVMAGCAQFHTIA
jgi:hypothetical protein